MPNDLLLTVHSPGALDLACRRGFWFPLPIPYPDAYDLTHLAVLQPGAVLLSEVVEITSLEPWYWRDGMERWLPCLGTRRRLRHPIPIGSARALEYWLPTSPQQYRLLDLNRLMVAESLAALISGSEREGRRHPQDPAA